MVGTCECGDKERLILWCYSARIVIHSPCLWLLNSNVNQRMHVSSYLHTVAQPVHQSNITQPKNMDNQFAWPTVVAQHTWLKLVARNRPITSYITFPKVVSNFFTQKEFRADMFFPSSVAILKGFLRSQLGPGVQSRWACRARHTGPAFLP